MSEGKPMDIGFTKPPCGSLAKFALEPATEGAPRSILRRRCFYLTLLCTRAEGHDGAHQAAAGSIAFEWFR